MRRLATALLSLRGPRPLAAAGHRRRPAAVIYNGPLGDPHTSPSASPPARQRLVVPAERGAPRPVVLGARHLWPHAEQLAGDLSPLLANDGYCVFALDSRRPRRQRATGVYGVGDSPSRPRSRGLRRPRPRRDGVGRVRPVGHSQGGLMPRDYLKVPARGGQGPHARRARLLESLRHHVDRYLHPRGLLPRRRPASSGRAPQRRTAAGRVTVPDRPQRRRRDGRRCPLHGDPVTQRRGGTPSTLAFLSGPTSPTSAPAAVPARPGRAPLDALRPHRRGRRAHRARPRAPGAAGVHTGPPGQRRLGPARRRSGIAPRRADGLGSVREALGHRILTERLDD